MRLRCLSLLTLACSQFSPMVAIPAKAAEPTAAELIGLAPVIESSNGRNRSIQLGGHIWLSKQTSLKFRASYRAPDEHALLISDGKDNTPLFLVSEHQGIQYDPIKNLVYYNKPIYETFSMIQSGDKLKMGFGWEKESEKAIGLSMDVRSFFSGQSKGDEVVKTGDRRYRLTRTSALGNYLVCHVDLTLKQPYTRIEFLLTEDRAPFMIIDTILVNEPLMDQEFTFPDKRQLESKLTVRDWPGEGQHPDWDSMSLFSLACLTRAAADDPEMRDAIKLSGAADIDWEEVRNNDLRSSSVLRELLSFESRVSASQDRSKKRARR